MVSYMEIQDTLALVPVLTFLPDVMLESSGVEIKAGGIVLFLYNYMFLEIRKWIQSDVYLRQRVRFSQCTTHTNIHTRSLSLSLSLSLYHPPYVYRIV